MANIRDFAVAEVLTAPSPATTGTTLVLKSGQGSDMPTTVPFKLTAFPKGVMPTKSNSEVILVTARSTDTLTIVRAQGEASAKSIAADWLVINTIYSNDIFTGGLVLDEILAGSVNGTNKVFTTSQNFTGIDVRKNGVSMHVGATYDFTVTGANQITFNTAPTAGIVTASYAIGGQVLISGGLSTIRKEAPQETPNGTRTLFTAQRPYVAGTLQVFINGLNEGNKVAETNPSLGTFTLDTAYASTTDIQLNYQFGLTGTANSDTVDGKHASELSQVGDIIMSMRTVAGINRLFMAGGTFNKADYPLLWALNTLHPAYFTASTTLTFTLADMRTRVPVGKDAGSFATLGAMGGAATHSHDSGNMKANAEFFTTGGTFYMDTQQVSGAGYTGYSANVRHRVAGNAGDDANSEVQDSGIKVGGFTSDATTLQPYIVINYEVIAG